MNNDLHKLNNVITFDEDCKLWILSIFNCIVDEDRIVVDADTLEPVKDNMGTVVRLDTFAGIYKKGNDIGFIAADLVSLVQCLDDMLDTDNELPKEKE